MPIVSPPKSEYKKADWKKKPFDAGGKPYKWYTVKVNDKNLVGVGNRPEVGMAWYELTYFNWGTKVPAEINWYLKKHVECWGKTPDGKNFEFLGGEKVWIPDKTPPSSPPGALSAAKTPSSGKSTSTAAVTYLPGDILLRAGEEGWIMEMTGGPYSHAGDCVDGAKEEGVDAHPGVKGHEVRRFTVADFFSVSEAPGGGDVFRYTGAKDKAKAAAKWAEGEVSKYYIFDLWDPIIGPTGAVQDNNSLYCSEFVWRSYRTGAGVTLVDPKDFLNLKDPAVYERNIAIITKVAKDNGQIPKYLPGFYARKKVKDHFKSHNGRFLAPRQLADSALTKKVHSIRGGAKMPGSSGASTSSGKK